MWGPNTYDRPRIPRSSHSVAEDPVRGNIRLIPKNRHDILETLKRVVQDRLPVDVGAGRHVTNLGRSEPRQSGSGGLQVALRSNKESLHPKADCWAWSRTRQRRNR